MGTWVDKRAQKASPRAMEGPPWAPETLSPGESLSVMSVRGAFSSLLASSIVIGVQIKGDSVPGDFKVGHSSWPVSLL